MLKLNYKDTSDICVGIDEAGRGCMIGPVFAAAVIWDNSKIPTGIKDSKKISRKNRHIVRKYIEDNSIAYGVGYASHIEIEDINIQNAT